MVEILFRRSLNGDLQKRWEQTWEAFCRFGAIGYRASRCAGAFRVQGLAGEQKDYESAVEKILKPAGFEVRYFWGEKRNSWLGIVELAEEELKKLRREFPAREPSPLGQAGHKQKKEPRQASAVYFRPLKLAEKKVAKEYYSLLLFEAPHLRVVGEESRLKNVKNGTSILKRMYPH